MKETYYCDYCTKETDHSTEQHMKETSDDGFKTIKKSDYDKQFPKETPDWEKEFDEKYGAFELCDVVSFGDRERLKSFIATTIATTRAKAYTQDRMDEAKTCEGCRNEKVEQMGGAGAIIEEV